MQLSSGPSDTGNRPRFGRAIIFVIAGVTLLGLYLARSHTPSTRSTDQVSSAGSDSVIIPAQMILPADFDDGTRFSGRVIAVLEPVQEVLLPELRLVEKALGHMLVTDLASDSNLQVVSREKVSSILAELQMSEAGLESQGLRLAAGVDEHRAGNVGRAAQAPRCRRTKGGCPRQRRAGDPGGI